MYFLVNQVYSDVKRYLLSVLHDMHLATYMIYNREHIKREWFLNSLLQVLWVGIKLPITIATLYVFLVNDMDLWYIYDTKSLQINCYNSSDNKNVLLIEVGEPVSSSPESEYLTVGMGYSLFKSPSLNTRLSLCHEKHNSLVDAKNNGGKLCLTY